MIWEIIKKQIVTFVRDRTQLILLLGLPIILIVILSVSLSGFMNGETIEIEANIAIIEHTSEEKQIERFIKEIEQVEMPVVNKDSIIKKVKHIAPIHQLKHDVLGELDTIFHITDIDPSEKDQALRNGDYTAVIEIPENFTYDLLRHIIFEESKKGNVVLYEKREIGAAAVKSVLESYEEQLAMSLLLEEYNIEPAIIEVNTNYGEQISLGQKRQINSKDYYTVGMAVMNVLYIASVISSFAFSEKRSQVFNRIILANVSRWTYFFGIFISSVLFSFTHLSIIFSFSWLVFGVSWSIVPFVILTFFFAMAVGGLATLMTSISYKMNSEQAFNFLGSILVPLFALVGGSFFPIGNLSYVIQVIGDFTPNGAAMSGYLSLLRDDDLLNIMPYLSYLIIFTCIALLMAVVSFPKRGKDQ